MLTVNVQQEKYSVHQGDSLKVICSWSGVPSATSVLWKKYVAGSPTDIIVANSNGKYDGASISSPSLIINSAYQDDEATYLCTATNAEGTSNSQPVKVEVTGGTVFNAEIVGLLHRDDCFSYLTDFSYFLLIKIFRKFQGTVRTDKKRTF